MPSKFEGDDEDIEYLVKNLREALKMDRRFSWDEFEKNYPVEYAQWAKDAMERAKNTDYIILRDDGRLDLTTDEGANWEKYFVWDGKWRKTTLEEIRGAIYKDEI